MEYSYLNEILSSSIAQQSHLLNTKCFNLLRHKNPWLNISSTFKSVMFKRTVKAIYETAVHFFN